MLFRWFRRPVCSFGDTASIDGIRRLYWFRNFPGTPLRIMAAAAEQDIYAAWRRRALRIGALMVVFGSAFIGLAALLGSEHGCVTASIGAVSCTPRRDHDVAAVINAADEALYNAKATGRNKVSLSQVS